MPRALGRRFVYTLPFPSYKPGLTQALAQVALDRTAPDGRVVGIDIIPAQPPKGVSTIQGNFLSPAVQEEVKRFLREAALVRPKPLGSFSNGTGVNECLLEQAIAEDPGDYFELERRAELRPGAVQQNGNSGRGRKGIRGRDEVEGRMVDVVLSDMSAPWDQTEGFWKRSLSNPYFRMMNTSGMSFRDHAGSMVWTHVHFR